MLFCSSDCPTSIAVRTSEGALQTTGGSEREAQVAAQHRTGKEYSLYILNSVLAFIHTATRMNAMSTSLMKDQSLFLIEMQVKSAYALLLG